MQTIPSLINYVRWCPPDYVELKQMVTADNSSVDWVSFDLKDCQQRCYVWLPWSVMLRYGYGLGEPWYEPAFPWRIDVLSLEQNGDMLTMKDMFADVIVSEDGNRYKILDLDELVEAVAHGIITDNDCFNALQTLQRWLDTLHGFRIAKDFPPKSLPIFI